MMSFRPRLTAPPHAEGDQAGFVLVNALVIVAAMAAAAVLLLSRAEGGRVRLETGTQADQLALALSAHEALARDLLTRDADGGADHLEEDWATLTKAPLTLARGEVAGAITDQQGLFNLNWLTNSSLGVANPGFDRLLADLGLSPSVGTAIRTHLAPRGQASRRPYRRMDPPSNPVGGPLLMLPQLSDIPGLRPRDIDRLTPFLTALPGDSPFNPNTAPRQVLAALLPDLSQNQISQLIRARSDQPFTAANVFMDMVNLSDPAQETPPGTEPGAPTVPPSEQDRLFIAQISVSSEWFLLDTQAQLGDATATQQAMLWREGIPATTRIIWRLTTKP